MKCMSLRREQAYTMRRKLLTLFPNGNVFVIKQRRIFLWVSGRPKLSDGPRTALTALVDWPIYGSVLHGRGRVSYVTLLPTDESHAPDQYAPLTQPPARRPDAIIQRGAAGEFEPHLSSYFLGSTVLCIVGEFMCGR